METNRFAFLRQVLFADALGTAACALPMLLAPGVLASVLELPSGLLFGAALSLMPFVALVTAVAWPAEPRAAGVWLVVALNFAWALGSAVVAFSAAVAPNALGYAFIAAQALFVVALAELELVGLRRARVTSRAVGGVAA